MNVRPLKSAYASSSSTIACGAASRIRSTAPGGIVITYSAGYATVPAPLVHAARLLVGGWFLNREAAQDRTISSLPAAVALESIVNSYRMPFAGGHSV